jgi:predicted ATPase/tRNA A-37 threonylcarbamoyl transferase component Bud32
MGAEWKRVRALFEQALDVAPERRAALLDAACDGDAELRREVESLLAARERAGGLLAAPTVEAGLPSTLLLEVGDDDPQSDLLAGTLLDGKYRIDALLGRGGMGEVYRATDLELGREVAVKRVRGEFVATRALADRFKREALTVARLRHRHVVSVYDFGLAPEAGMYLVMEYLEGRSLGAEVRRLGRLPVATAVELMRQICSAVDAAHAAGIVHRDLKPENIFLERAGEGLSAKVLDFGIAKPKADGTPGREQITKAGAVLGTPAYMAPEQCLGHAVDARTDVYALGCVLYEMLAGRPPFEGASVGELTVKHCTEPPPSPALLRSDVTARMSAAVLRALAKAPEDRFQTAGALARAIDGPQPEARVAAFAGTTSPNVGPSHTGVAADTAAVGHQLTGDGGRRTPPLHNLPQAMTSFIGRKQHLAAVGLRLETARLVTLTGFGGVGKSRLAIEVGRDALAAFGDGVWLVELAALSDPALVPQTVAKALGVREEPGRAVDATLADFLKRKEALLVVDNCEHLVDACARLVDRLLRACANLRVLATSREPLGVAGEAVWPVPALEVAPGGEASRLFVDRAALAKPGFSMTETSAPTIAAIGRRLEGIPLAIELAASRVKVLPVEQILARLEDRFRLLTAGSRTAPSRQQTLRAALDWSYELLTEEERALLRRLSVFAGGWTLEATEAVDRGSGSCGGRRRPRTPTASPRASLPPASAERTTDHGPRTTDEVLQHLERLLDKSLVVVEEGEAPRYGMLETVREYARERLVERGESDEVARLHAGFFLPFGTESWVPPASAQWAEWYTGIEAEHDNVRAALGWSLEHDSEVCLWAAMRLGFFWYDHGYLTEGRSWLDAAIGRARSAPVHLRRKALIRVGHITRRQGDFAAAGAIYEETMRLAKEAGNLREIAGSSLYLGVVALDRNDWPRARAYAEDCLAIGRELEEPPFVVEALNLLGEVARSTGQLKAARVHYEEAAVVARQENLLHLLAPANLGAVAREEGDLVAATAHYEEALGLYRAKGDMHGIAGVLDELGAVAAAQGAWRRAARLAGVAQALRNEIGSALDPTERVDRDRYVAEARAALGEAEFDAATAEGRALTLDAAMNEASESGNRR